jgi:hypothetical protein
MCVVGFSKSAPVTARERWHLFPFSDSILGVRKKKSVNPQQH